MVGGESNFLKDIADWFVALAGSAFAAAVAGRLAWHTRLVQQGERNFLSWELLLELPLVFVGYILGSAVATYLGYSNSAVVSGIVMVVAYLGPGGVQAIMMKYFAPKQD